LESFFALMAAMTLLLAHLDSHRHPQISNILAHQYLSDRAMIEQTQEDMEEMNRRDGSSLGAKSAVLLSRLLIILGEAADGNTHSLARVSVSLQAPETEMEQPGEENNRSLRFFVPYCGIINIAREGTISKESPTSHYSLASIMHNELANLSESPYTEVDNSIGTRQDYAKELPSLLRPRLAVQSPTQAQQEQLSVPLAGFNVAAPQLVPQFPSPLSDNLLQQYDYPIPTAGFDDWAFQVSLIS
jgi:hypothetical protein